MSDELAPSPLLQNRRDEVIRLREAEAMADFWAGVEVRMERIESHRPHLPTRVADSLDGLNLTGLARSILTDGGAS